MGAADRLAVALEQHRQGRTAEAEAGYRAVLAGRPDQADALHLLGMLLAQTGRAVEGERMVARAAALSPGAVDMQVTLGTIRRALGRADAAEAALRTALTLDPGAPQACLHLGCLLQERGRTEEAEAMLARAAAGDPGQGDAWHRLGRLAEERGDPARAAECLERALDAGATPRAAILVRLLRQLAALARWDRHAALLAGLQAALEDDRDGSVPPPLLLDLPLVPDWHVRAAKARAEAIRRSLPSPPARAAAAPRTEGRLRIGYLCDDLGDQPMLQRIVAAHDRDMLDPLVFTRRAMAAGCPIRHTSLAGETADGLLHRLSSAALDALVLLDALGPGFEPAVAAARPAPLIVHWPGHPGTLGGLADYLLADPVLVPPGRDRLYAEAVVRLPVLPAAEPLGASGEAAAARRAAGLPDGAVLYCALHPPHRITRAILGSWLRILDGCPAGLLRLPAPAAEAARAWLGAAAAAGIDPRRLGFVGPGAEMDGMLAAADLFLDTPLVGAGRMAARALAAGVPVLGWSGDMLAGRRAAGLLTPLGLGDLVAASPPAYEATAIALGRDAAARAALRARLAAGLAGPGGPFDAVLAARALEAAFGAMVDRSRTGLPPTAFTIQAAEA